MMNNSKHLEEKIKLVPVKRHGSCLEYTCIESPEICVEICKGIKYDKQLITPFKSKPKLVKTNYDVKPKEFEVKQQDKIVISITNDMDESVNSNIKLERIEIPDSMRYVKEVRNPEEDRLLEVGRFLLDLMNAGNYIV